MEDPTDWPHSQRFACSATGCSYSHLLPEHPTRGPATVRAGCPWCETLTRQRAVGRVAPPEARR